MTKLKSKRFLPQWISNTYNQIRRGLGRAFNFNKKMQDPAAQFIHNINKQSHLLNKNIIHETASMKKVPLNKEIYSKNPASKAPVSQPALNPQPLQPPPAVSNISQNSMNNETAKEFIDRLTSVEKKIDRFFNLIERRVVKNAKEINIRIKLNENTNTEQE